MEYTLHPVTDEAQENQHIFVVHFRGGASLTIEATFYEEDFNDHDWINFYNQEWEDDKKPSREDVVASVHLGSTMAIYSRDYARISDDAP